MTEHSDLRSIAEQLTGETLPDKTSTSLIRIIEQNIGESLTKATQSNFTLTDPDVDTLTVDTSGGAVSVTLGEGLEEKGNEIRISDVTSNAGTNNITIQTETDVTIDGDSSVAINSDGGSVALQYSDKPKDTKFTVVGGVGVNL